MPAVSTLLARAVTDTAGKLYATITPVRGLQIKNNFGSFLVFLGPTKLMNI